MSVQPSTASAMLESTVNFMSPIGDGLVWIGKESGDLVASIYNFALPFLETCGKFIVDNSANLMDLAKENQGMLIYTAIVVGITIITFSIFQHCCCKGSQTDPA